MANKLVPWNDVDDLRNRFHRAFSQWLEGDGRNLTPAIDVERGNKALTIRADLPGVTPDHVKIEVENGVLTISGDQEEQNEQKDSRYLRRERHSGSFVRSIGIPDGVDPSKITARTSDGVVEVTIPLPDHSNQEPVTITPTAA